MLTKIVHHSPPLCAFLDPLIGSLTEPQRQHLRDFCDAILVCEGAHTIANLQRQFVETTDPSNWADFLRIAPWDANGDSSRWTSIMIIPRAGPSSRVIKMVSFIWWRPCVSVR